MKGAYREKKIIFENINFSRMTTCTQIIYCNISLFLSHCAMPSSGFVRNMSPEYLKPTLGPDHLLLESINNQYYQRN